MSWNIQNFGQNTQLYELTKGRDSNVLAKTIAAIVQAQGIDILGIMEIQPGCLSHLINLLAELNSDTSLNPRYQWCYDWIKCSVAATTPVGPVTQSNQLSWNSGANAPRQEGYAIFWKNQHPGFQMLQAAQPMSEGTQKMNFYLPVTLPQHCLSLSIQGRDVGLGPYNRPVATTGINFSNLAANWVYSHYPDVGHGIDPYTLRWSSSRRPAYCIIEVNIPNVPRSNRLCPIYMYHAPSHNTMANFGTFVSGLGQELYVVHSLDGNGVPNGPFVQNAMVIASGDYNVNASTTSDWNNFYTSYYAPLSQLTTAGAGCGSVYTPDNAYDNLTTIQLNEMGTNGFNGDIINTDFIKDYEKLPIDNIFARGFGNLQNKGYIYSLDRVIQKMFNPFSPLLREVYAARFDEIIKVVTQAGWPINPKYGPRNPKTGAYLFNFMNDWSTFVANIKSGEMTNARAAAEFTRMFVSDHLPLVFEFTVP